MAAIARAQAEETLSRAADIGEALVGPDGAIEPCEDLIALQQALERRMHALSHQRGLSRLDRAAERGAESATGFGARAVAEGLDALTAAVRRDRETAKARPGATPEALKMLAPLEPETIAYLALRGIVDLLSRQPKLGTAAMRVGDLLAQEARARAAEEEKRAVGQSETDRAPDRAPGEGLRPRRPRRWTAARRQSAGMRLIHLAIEALDLAEIVETPVFGGDARCVRRLCPSARSVARRERARETAANIAPLYEPMVCPPRPWLSAHGGGYLGPIGAEAALVKTRERDVLERLDPSSAPLVFAAVNAAQATPWSINPRILAVMNAFETAPGEVFENAAARGVEAPFPSPSPLVDAQQAAPAGEEAKENATEVSREQAAATERWALWRAERRRRSQRLAWDRMLAQARRYARMPAFYFPYQYDFRGRLYATPEFSPQGPDPMRGLLRFAHAEPLGPEGWKWLAIHLCNCGDFERMSKAPLSARAEWTLEHEPRILSVAADPLANLWWAEADQPWQFLAACFEWEGYAAQGEAFQSTLPVALDGSCSGIQHFSLALRDEIGGAAVNLRNRSEVGQAGAADIYSEVAAAVRERLSSDLHSEEAFSVGRAEGGGAKQRPVAELARAWLDFGVDRALCKRPTMTYGYGARGYGYVEQILEDTLAPALAAHRADPGRRWPFEGRGFGEALYLASRMTEAIEQTVLKAAEAMRWLQEIADLATGEGCALRWTAPDGFPVTQAYREQVERRVKTQLSDKPVRLILREETGRLDARRQRQGVAPNFVHSLDACHLRLTVQRAAEEGIADLALVHDSFGAHAAKTPRFFQLLRETLVEMYETVDVTADFREQIAAALSADGADAMAQPPEKGGLSLECVLKSEHCFS